MATKYISLTYRDLWTTVETHRRMESKTTDKDERFALRFSTMLLLFFMFEAYLNHLGEKIAPDIWADERNNFNGRNKITGKRYLGPIGKCEYLQLRGSLPEDLVMADIAVIKELKQFRDLLAHGRTEEETTSYTCQQGDPLEIHTPKVWELVNSDLLERSLSAVKAQIIVMHDAALTASPSSGLEPSPFVSSFIQITTVTSP